MLFNSHVTILVLCSLLGAQALNITKLVNSGLNLIDTLPLKDLGIGDTVYSTILNLVDKFNCKFHEDVDYDLSQLELCYYGLDSEDVATTYNVTAGAGQLFLDMGSDAANYSYNIFIPGFNAGPNKTSWNVMRTAFQTLNDSSMKYLALNHTAYTTLNALTALKSYDDAVTYTYHIGKQMGIYISELVLNYSIPIENIYVMGHSLGAQMTGVCANHVQNLTGQSLPRITGLDPARPCFSDQPMKYVIDDSDADYVDIMHCNAGELGWTNNYGSADFYPNGGEIQPECKSHKLVLLHTVELSTCSHSFCPAYFASSLLNPLIGWNCNSYTNYTAGHCNENVAAMMGLQHNATTNGTYYCTIE